MSGATSGHAPAVWDRIVCAVDLTPASVRAACEVAELMPPAAQLILCAIFDPDGDNERRVLSGGTRDAAIALDRVQRQVEAFRDCELHLREGPPVQRLMAELADARATMVAIGSDRDSRDVGVMLGHVATAMLEQAACSVLVAHDTRLGRARRAAATTSSSASTARAAPGARSQSGPSSRPACRCA